MNKKEWIEWFTSERFKDADGAVIKFIADILYSDSAPKGSDAIYNLFASGYCYYFAVMLKEAFKRGEICWHRNHGHIVWRDENGIAYDIGGVFEEDDLLPADKALDDMLCDFKHNGEKFSAKGWGRFSDWISDRALQEGTNEYAIAARIYMSIPEDKRKDDISVMSNVVFYWYEHELEFSQGNFWKEESNA